MFDSFTVTQGATLGIDGVLKDSAGVIVTGIYTSANDLTTTLWPGGPTPAAAVGTTTWVDPAVGTFHIEIDSAQTAALYSGVYQGVTRLTDGSATPDAYYFLLTVANGPGGIPTAPTSALITRLVVETELVDRDSALLLLCGKSTTADGNNRHCTGAIGFALQCLGITPAIPGVVSDADLALVPASKYFLLCDLAEYRLIKNLINSFAQPDQTTGNTKIHLNSMTDRFRKQLNDLEKQYGAYLGLDRSILSAGSIRLGHRPRWGHHHGFGSCDDF
jgi:hypothetical protein